MHEKILVARVRGDVRGHYVREGLWTPVTPLRHNTLLYDWATIVGELLRGAPSGKPYKIGGMYLEFVNGEAISPPTIGRDEGVSYFGALPTGRDYLRVPLVAASLASNDEGLYPGGNRLTFFAQSQGTVGIGGMSFSDTAGSRVVGAALVAFPGGTDSTQDLVFSRFYFPTEEQIVKIAGSQIGIEWPVTLY